MRRSRLSSSAPRTAAGSPVGSARRLPAPYRGRAPQFCLLFSVCYKVDVFQSFNEMPSYMTFRAFQRVEANTGDRCEGFWGPPLNTSFRSNNVNVLMVISGVT